MNKIIDSDSEDKDSVKVQREIQFSVQCRTVQYKLFSIVHAVCSKVHAVCGTVHAVCSTLHAV